jgi:hypothetical protein
MDDDCGPIQQEGQVQSIVEEGKNLLYMLGMLHVSGNFKFYIQGANP